MRGQNRSTVKGFTLVEVMVAALLFAIVMLYGLSFFVYGAKPMIRAQEYSFALNAAKSQIECLKNEKFENIMPVTGTINRPEEFFWDENNTQYTARTEIVGSWSGNAANEYFECYARITTVVSWVPPAKKDDNDLTETQKIQSISLSTVIAPPPTFYKEEWSERYRPPEHL